MKLSEIEAGKIYAAQVSGRIVPVTVIEIVERYCGPRAALVKRVIVRNERTQRVLTVSPQRLRLPGSPVAN